MKGRPILHLNCLYTPCYLGVLLILCKCSIRLPNVIKYCFLFIFHDVSNLTGQAYRHELENPTNMTFKPKKGCKVWIFPTIIRSSSVKKSLLPPCFNPLVSSHNTSMTKRQRKYPENQGLQVVISNRDNRFRKS